MSDQPTPPPDHEILTTEFLREHGAQEGMMYYPLDYYSAEWIRSIYKPGNTLTEGDLKLGIYCAPVGTMARVLGNAAKGEATMFEGRSMTADERAALDEFTMEQLSQKGGDAKCPITTSVPSTAAPVVPSDEAAASELNPCPFCGAEAVITQFHQRVAVNCGNPECWAQQKGDKAEAGKIFAAWNRRTASPTPAPSETPETEKRQFKAWGWPDATGRRLEFTVVQASFALEIELRARAAEEKESLRTANLVHADEKIEELQSALTAAQSEAAAMRSALESLHQRYEIMGPMHRPPEAGAVARALSTTAGADILRERDELREQVAELRMWNAGFEETTRVIVADRDRLTQELEEAKRERDESRGIVEGATRNAGYSVMNAKNLPGIAENLRLSFEEQKGIVDSLRAQLTALQAVAIDAAKEGK